MPDMQKMTAEEVGHDTRKKISAVIDYAKSIKADTDWSAKGGREMALAFTKLQEAKMWVGKFLEENGSELPAQYRDDAV